nr:hypothetical protein CFP56_34509 [Quercus suber]
MNPGFETQKYLRPPIVRGKRADFVRTIHRTAKAIPFTPYSEDSDHQIARIDINNGFPATIQLRARYVAEIQGEPRKRTIEREIQSELLPELLPCVFFA